MPEAHAAISLAAAVDRQVERLRQLGHSEIADLTPTEFDGLLSPLKLRLSGIEPTPEKHVPFVIVVSRGRIPPEKTISAVDLNGKSGFTTMEPDDIACFEPIPAVDIPDAPAYLLADVDTGRDFLNITPDDALKEIEVRGRLPLTLEEGIALVYHYPELLRTHNAFSMLGSRCGDRRVTALWLSGGRPRLGWCWAGNPHTWLGSASCAARLAS